MWMWNGIFMFCFQNTKKRSIWRNEIANLLAPFAICIFHLQFEAFQLGQHEFETKCAQNVFFCISRWIFLRLEILLYQYSAADKYEVWAERSTRTYIFYIRFSLYVPRVDKWVMGAVRKTYFVHYSLHLKFFLTTAWGGMADKYEVWAQTAEPKHSATCLPQDRLHCTDCWRILLFLLS